MSFFKKISSALSKYDSRQVLRVAVKNYLGSYEALERAAYSFEDLSGIVDQLSEKEFEALRKEIPSLMMVDRSRLASFVIGGGLTAKQFESVRSRAEVRSQLLYSAGFCRNTQKPPNYAKGVELLRAALKVRPKPRMYALREVQPDVEDLSVIVTDRIVTVESRHLPMFVSENQVESTANEVVSFRDAEFFGMAYMGLAKALTYSRVEPEEANHACDVAIYYLEKTRHFDLNILLRGICWFDKGMSNYYVGRVKEALDCYTQAYPFYESVASKIPSQGMKLGVADCLLYKGECELLMGMRKEAKVDLELALNLSVEIGQRDNQARAFTFLRQLETIKDDRSIS